jgi:hypothetical protein
MFTSTPKPLLNWKAYPPIIENVMRSAISQPTERVVIEPLEWAFPALCTFFPNLPQGRFAQSACQLLLTNRAIYVFGITKMMTIASQTRIGLDKITSSSFSQCYRRNSRGDSLFSPNVEIVIMMKINYVDGQCDIYETRYIEGENYGKALQKAVADF